MAGKMPEKKNRGASYKSKSLNVCGKLIQKIGGKKQINWWCERTRASGDRAREKEMGLQKGF